MTRRDRIMLMVIAAVAVLGGFYMFVLKPRQAAVKDAQAQVDAARQTLADAQAQANSGKAAQQAFQRDRATLLKIGRVVPENDDIPTLQVQLLRIAKKQKVYVTEFNLTGSGASASAGSTSVTTPQGTTPSGSGSTDAVAPLYPPGSVQMAGGLGRTPIEIKLKGRFFELEAFLRAVQRYAVISSTRREAKGRLLVVDGFSYEASDRAVEGDNKTKKYPHRTSTFLSAKLVASVYFAPPVATPSTGSGAAGATTPPAGATPSGAGTATGTATAGGLQ